MYICEYYVFYTGYFVGVMALKHVDIEQGRHLDDDDS
jgi:hypothetical protein